VGTVWAHHDSPLKNAQNLNKAMQPPIPVRLKGVNFYLSGDLATHRCVIVLGRTQQTKKSDGIEKIVTRFLSLNYSIIWLDKSSALNDEIAIVNQRYAQILEHFTTSERYQSILENKSAKRIVKLVLLMRRPSFWTFSNVFALFDLAHPFAQARIRFAANLRARKLKKIEQALPKHAVIILSTSSGCRASALPSHLNNVKAMICFGYPFKNLEIRYNQPWRTKPLTRVNKPFFVFQGDHDEYLNAAEAANIPKSAHVALKTVQGTHDYSTLTDQEIDEAFKTLAPYMSTD
jgi:hypothetical protein